MAEPAGLAVVAGLEGVARMKDKDPETFHSLVRRQFDDLLGLDPESSREVWEGRKKCRKQSVDSRLTEERADIIYQVVEYLGLDRSLQEEGVFRKNAVASRREELVSRLEAEGRLPPEARSLELAAGGEFTVHEAAAALKALLAGLAEPLLTDHCFPAVCALGDAPRAAWLPGLGLLLQLVPGPEGRLLKDLLHMLLGTAARQAENRMSAGSLATIFMTHLLCPRWLKPEELQARYGPLTALTTLMVEEAEHLFTVPPQLVAAVEEVARRRSSQGCVSLARQEDGPGVTSLIASTVFNFVDRGQCLEDARPAHPVLTQYRINRQILDMNGLPPGAPYISSHDTTMPL